MDSATRKIVNPKPDWLALASQPSDLTLGDRLTALAAIGFVLLAAGCIVAFLLG